MLEPVGPLTTYELPVNMICRTYPPPWNSLIILMISWLPSGNQPCRAVEFPILFDDSPMNIIYIRSAWIFQRTIFDFWRERGRFCQIYINTS